MNFFPAFDATHVVPTSTISVNPPGGTGGPHAPHSSHLPLPTVAFPEPTHHLLHATRVGHTALWVFVVLFAAGLVGAWVLSLRVERRARFFHGLILAITLVSYLAMATGLGSNIVPTNYHGHAGRMPAHHGHGHSHGHNSSLPIDVPGASGGPILYARQTYWLRYLDWALVTPLLMYALSTLAGSSPAATMYIVVSDVFMVVLCLLASQMPARYIHGIRARWAFFALGGVAFLMVFSALFLTGAKAAQLRKRRTRGIFYLLASMTTVAFIAYPIIFGLSEGGNIISVNAEIIAYGIMDLGFTLFILLIHTHDEDNYLLPEWWVEPRVGLGPDGRGDYGAIRDE